MSKKYIAIDLGASSGRVIVGNLEGFEVTRRFITRNECLQNRVYWDILYIFSEIKEGIKEAFNRFGDEIVSIGVDTWGVDFVLLDQSDELVSMPYHYRDSRTDGMMEEVLSIIDREQLYRSTGNQFMQLNTLYQLYAFKKKHPKLVEAAETYLSIPDLINYMLTGKKVNEYSHATTTQLYNPTTRDWAWDVIDALGFNRNWFGPVVPSGTVVGPLCDQVRKEVGAKEHVSVIASACHDTAAAVAAVPAREGEQYMYLSSGTWSLLGVEVDQPIITEQSIRYNFTNEGAASGAIRFLKNIMGMWIQQESVRFWESQGEKISLKELDQETLEEMRFTGYIDPNDDRFLKPNSASKPMHERVQDYCREHCGVVPETKGEIMVAIYRGLAKAYARYIKQMEETTGKKYDTLYIIGGGSKNFILNQWTADEVGIPVYAGPVEATALGNMLIQALAMGSYTSIRQGREVIRKNQEIKRYDPQ